MLIQSVKISDLSPNTGQVEGLPKNPRIIKDERYKKLLKSIKEDPEMLQLREVIAYSYKGLLIVIAGNMRLKACKELGFKEIPCKILPEDTPLQKLKAYIIKDNVSFGDHDFALLELDWELEELEGWGVEMPGFDLDADKLGTDFTLPDGDKAPFQQMTFTLADEQAEQIKNAIADIKETEEYKYAETMGNENSNGNALYLIIMQWVEQRK